MNSEKPKLTLGENYLVNIFPNKKIEEAKYVKEGKVHYFETDSACIAVLDDFMVEKEGIITHYGKALGSILKYPKEWLKNLEARA